MGWIAIDNPNRDNFETSQEYLAIAYERGLKATIKKLKIT